MSFTGVERIDTKLRQDENGCWIWTAGKSPKGYGRLSIGGVARFAHRVVYELVKGPIPEGLTLDHLCRVRSCTNPAHLEPVTGGTNTLRGVSAAAEYARRSACGRGHEFTPENTYLFRGRVRRCRTCKREDSRRRRAEK